MKDDFVFASNSFFLKFNELEFKPQFLTVEDHLVAEDNRIKFQELKGIIKFFPFDLRKTLRKDKDTVYVNLKRAAVHHTSDKFPLFNCDCEKYFYWGGTVLYMSLQLAAHMGFTKIYLLGVDLSYQIPDDALIQGSVITSQSDDPNHFNGEYFGKGKRWHLPEVDRMQRAFDHANKAICEKGSVLYNVTIGGNLKNVPRNEYVKLFK
jgi:hypothetical protein